MGMDGQVVSFASVGFAASADLVRTAGSCTATRSERILSSMGTIPPPSRIMGAMGGTVAMMVRAWGMAATPQAMSTHNPLKAMVRVVTPNRLRGVTLNRLRVVLLNHLRVVLLSRLRVVLLNHLRVVLLSRLRVVLLNHLRVVLLNHLRVVLLNHLRAATDSLTRQAMGSRATGSMHRAATAMRCGQGGDVRRRGTGSRTGTERTSMPALLRRVPRRARQQVRRVPRWVK